MTNIVLTDGGFFVFGDVSVKKVGEHRLLFSLFELQKYVHSPSCLHEPNLTQYRTTGEVVWHKSILSDVFTGMLNDPAALDR